MESPATLKQIPKVNVLGVGVSAIDLNTAEQLVMEALQTHARGYVCVTGVHGVSEAQADPAFREILNGAFLNTPDGMPMVWMGRIQKASGMDRVYGPDLMLRFCERTAQSGHSHFFYGGAPGVAQELKTAMERRFPGIKVAGTYTPPFRPLTPEEERQLQAGIEQSKPDIIWVGLSTPKQEKFMASHWKTLPATLFFGVGAAFDFHTGRVRQAPRWMQRSGLEWFFRLMCEPKRLWKRYLKNNPLFVMRAFLQITGLRRYRLK
jgi:N-acetylglucosaminyldiphosphoundecaprenol N-acetyl-beta-D-mannosaminyltransferase